MRNPSSAVLAGVLGLLLAAPRPAAGDSLTSEDIPLLGPADARAQVDPVADPLEAELKEVLRVGPGSTRGQKEVFRRALAILHKKVRKALTGSPSNKALLSLRWRTDELSGLFLASPKKLRYYFSSRPTPAKPDPEKPLRSLSSLVLDPGQLQAAQVIMTWVDLNDKPLAKKAHKHLVYVAQYRDGAGRTKIKAWPFGMFQSARLERKNFFRPPGTYKTKAIYPDLRGRQAILVYLQLVRDQLALDILLERKQVEHAAFGTGEHNVDDQNRDVGSMLEFPVWLVKRAVTAENILIGDPLDANCRDMAGIFSANIRQALQEDRSIGSDLLGH